MCAIAGGFVGQNQGLVLGVLLHPVRCVLLQKSQLCRHTLSHSPGCWVSYPVPERDLGVGGLDDSPHAPEEVGREHDGLHFVAKDFSLLLAREMAGPSALGLVGHRSRRVCSRAQLLEARRGLGRERGERAGGAGRGGRRLLQPQVRAEEV